MKRRDVLKGAAVAAGAEVQASPNRCCERDHDGDGNCDRHPVGKVNVLFSLFLPGPFDKLAEQLQEGIEELEQSSSGPMEVTQPVTFEPVDKEGNDWLVAPLCNPTCDPIIIFEMRQWSVIQQWVSLRKYAYWHHLEPGSKPSLAWHKAQRENLGGVRVEWVGLVTPRYRDAELVEHCTRSGGTSTR